MKKVCIYCQTWESGGIEAFLRNVLCRMDLSGLQIDIVTDKMGRSIFTDELKRRGVAFWELSGSQKKLLQNGRRFAKLMRERKYDVLHLNVFQALPLAYLSLAKKEEIPLRIAHSHNTQLRKSATRWLKLQIHRLASQLFAKDATDLWACSADAANFMFPDVLLKKKAYRWIPNGIELKRFQFNDVERERAQKELGLERAFVIGHIGRLCYQKNQSFLLDVFARIHNLNPMARLLLIGEGEQLAELKEKAECLAIADSVIFYGTTSHVEKLLWTMDVFVFPSIFEGFGIVAIEAQAAGLPTICSDRVPQEVFVTNLAQKLPLDCPTEKWAQAVIEARTKPAAGCAWEQLKASGFDIEDAASIVANAYQNEKVKEK